MSSYEKANGMPIQGTAETKAYAEFRKRIDNLCKGHGDPEELAEWKERNALLAEMADMAMRDLRPSQVHVDEVLKTMSVMFANDELIGDRIMPVIMGNGKLSFVYYEYDKRDRTAYPDDTMSDRSDPNELGQNRSAKTVGLEVRSLKEYLDQYTIQNQDAPLNEIVDVVDNVLYGLHFRREIRDIAAATTAGNFGANTTALAAGDRWDGPTGGDPGAVVDAALAACWSGSGPGRFVAAMSLNVYNVLKRHPKILDTFKYSGTSAKMATRQMLAEYFEVDEVVVGKARNDTANRGQTASYARMWPDVFGVYRVSDRPSVRNAAFGYTFQDMPTQQDLQFLLEKSAKGAWQARATHADVQKIIAPECGFLITTPIG
jgi:hypothetical protein